MLVSCRKIHSSDSPFWSSFVREQTHFIQNASLSLMVSFTCQPPHTHSPTAVFSTHSGEDSGQQRAVCWAGSNVPHLTCATHTHTHTHIELEQSGEGDLLDGERLSCQEHQCHRCSPTDGSMWKFLSQQLRTGHDMSPGYHGGGSESRRRNGSCLSPHSALPAHGP